MTKDQLSDSIEIHKGDELALLVTIVTSVRAGSTLVILAFPSGKQPLHTIHNNVPENASDFHTELVRSLRESLSEGTDLNDFIASAVDVDTPKSGSGTPAGGSDDDGTDSATG